MSKSVFHPIVLLFAAIALPVAIHLAGVGRIGTTNGAETKPFMLAFWASLAISTVLAGFGIAKLIRQESYEG